MDRLSNVDWRGLYKNAANTVKKYTQNLSDLEIKVEDATNNDTWGPHGSVMTELADASYDFESYQQIMGVISKRFRETGENWRMVYKSLLLLEHLLKNGPPRVAADVGAGSAVLERLQHFVYTDPNGKDHGQNVRHRAKEICDLLDSPSRLQAEREKAAKNRAKYTGVAGGTAVASAGGLEGFGSGTGGAGAPRRGGFAGGGFSDRDGFGIASRGASRGFGGAAGGAARAGSFGAAGFGSTTLDAGTAGAGGASAFDRATLTSRPNVASTVYDAAASVASEAARVVQAGWETATDSAAGAGGGYRRPGEAPAADDDGPWGAQGARAPDAGLWGGRRGAGAGAGADAHGLLREDPVAATRSRIAGLQLEGGAEGGAAAGARDASASPTARAGLKAAANGREHHGGRGRKKLTDVRVSSKIAASLGGIAPLSGGSQRSTSALGGEAPAPPPDDLLGDLDDANGATQAADAWTAQADAQPSKAADAWTAQADAQPSKAADAWTAAAASASVASAWTAPAAGAKAAKAATAAEPGVWDPFGDAPTQADAPTASDPFAALEAPAQPAASLDPLEALAAPAPAAPAASASSSRAPLPLDMFSTLTPPEPAAAAGTSLGSLGGGLSASALQSEGTFTSGLGAVASGGALSTGLGAVASGGALSTGLGAVASGGALSTGLGAVASGGALSTGLGAVASGGALSPGLGAVASGGALPSFGTPTGAQAAAGGLPGVIAPAHHAQGSQHKLGSDSARHVPSISGGTVGLSAGHPEKDPFADLF